MKILWVEDFGGGILAGSKFAQQIFDQLFEEVNLEDVLDPDASDFAGELSRLFKEHTPHEICVCTSYLEWKKENEQQGGDFDIAIIDINLDSHTTPDDEKPEKIGGVEFDSKAGLYIYHQLIKQRLPEDNIALFTGESESAGDFLDHCGEILLDTPKNIIEKTPLGLKRLKEWITQKARSTTRKTGIKVLLVEDERDVLNILAKRFREDGYEVTTAENGHEALLLTRDDRFDVIVTDVMMPLVSGLELLEHFHTENPSTPVILLTGFALSSINPKKLLRFRAFDLIEKGGRGTLQELLDSARRATWEKSKGGKHRRLRVFLCHASEDKESVRSLYKKLSKAGFDPWVDKEKLLPGQDWQEEIVTAVKATDVVIVCLSRASISKEGYVQKEIKYALDLADEKPQGTIFLIPLRLEQCEIPSQLQRWQSADVFDQAEDYDRLLSALNRRADSLGLLGS